MTLVACGSDGPAAVEHGETTVSSTSADDERHQWLLAALDIVEARAYYSDRVDWSQARAGADRAAATGLMYSYLEEVLRGLGDSHSLFLRPHQAASFFGPQDSPLDESEIPEAVSISSRIGYLRIPSVTAGVTIRGDTVEVAMTDPAQQYVNAIRGFILANADICGWIVDLRNNGGGNAFLMLAGLQPLLGVGVVSRFAGRDGTVTGINLDADGVPSGVDALPRDWSEPFPAAATDAPVAVLINSSSASAAEAVLIAFSGRAGTRSFGTQTSGVPTANDILPLADGSALVLTVSVGLDRAGNLYEGPIQPDEVVPDVTTAPRPDDSVAAAASSWLETATPCG
jgi:carboxyl-terminal processing protease